MLLPQHLPCAKNACSMHDTICHAWSNAHEHHILTTSVTAKASREHKDMYKRVSARSTLLPLSAQKRVNCSGDTIENSKATAGSFRRYADDTSRIPAALLPRLHAAGRTPLQRLFHQEKEAIRTNTGLRKHRYRSREHVRSSAAEASRLIAGQRAKDRTGSGEASMRGAWLTVSIDPELTKTSKASDSTTA